MHQVREDEGGKTSRKRLAVGLALGAAGAAIAYRLLAQSGAGGRSEREEVTYPPLDTLKPVADDLWIVDSGPINASGMKLPVRMTVVRLSDGSILLHSPTPYKATLAKEIEALGSVRHLVAPTIAHWSFLPGWQRAFPEATTWAVPGLRDRAQVRKSGVRIDKDLGPEAPPEWSDELAQGIIPGGAGFREAWFFDRRSRTLLLCDLIENLEKEKMPPATGVLMQAAAATRGTTARHVRGVIRLGGGQAAEAIGAMIDLAPDRVIFSHGLPFEEDGAERLRRAFAWLKVR